ncbi:hypothetical protein IOD13_05120 [Brevibacterium casei]|nr:hypothetical protein [Brevibacterium casei]
MSPIRARDRLVDDTCTRAVTEHGLLFMVSGYAGTGKTWPRGGVIASKQHSRSAGV